MGIKQEHQVELERSSQPAGSDRLLGFECQWSPDAAEEALDAATGIIADTVLELLGKPASRNQAASALVELLESF